MAEPLGQRIIVSSWASSSGVLMRCLVTGAAGFVGSHLSERLLREGHHVRAVDAFMDNYAPRLKRANLNPCLGRDNFELIKSDLAREGQDVDSLVEDVDVVFHQAALPGVRRSWETFRSYLENNVVATQRLLETATRHRTRFVYASSSSVYGNLEQFPTPEDLAPAPYSPYGVTKLAAERLCVAYAENFKTPTVCLRYFSVYGPRQRPDMGIGRIIDSVLTGDTFTVYGSGEQIRDCTYVSDVVNANLAAAEVDLRPGAVMNIAGGSQVSLNELIDLVCELANAKINLARTVDKPGDVTRTGGTTKLARELLDWAPQVQIREGLARQIRWHRETLDMRRAALTSSDAHREA